MDALARAKNLRNCTCHNLRYYPMVQQMRRMREAGDLGEILVAQGTYSQDWLLYDTDWNWRIDPTESGPSRAMADIGALHQEIGRKARRHGRHAYPRHAAAVHGKIFRRVADQHRLDRFFDRRLAFGQRRRIQLGRADTECSGDGGSRRQAEHAEDARQVRLHGSFRQEQRATDVAVGVTLRDEHRDLALAIGQA